VGHSRAEELPAGLGTFRVVTFAASFHWMDRPLVAATVREMLEPNGVVVHVDNRHQDNLLPDDALAAPPRERIAELRREYLGADRRAGQSIRNTSPDDEAAVFRGAGFAGPEVVVVPDGRTIVRSTDEMVAETFSMSSTAPHLFGDRLLLFEADLRQVLAEASPDGVFSIRLPGQRTEDLAASGAVRCPTLLDVLSGVRLRTPGEHILDVPNARSSRQASRPDRRVHVRLADESVAPNAPQRCSSCGLAGGIPNRQLVAPHPSAVQTREAVLQLAAARQLPLRRSPDRVLGESAHPLAEVPCRPWKR
jgi:hypothetical protein